MSEIRTNLTISGESSEYRSNLQISVVTLNSNLVDTQSSFRTNLNIVSSLNGKTTTTLNTTLKLENTALDFYLVDMTKMNQSMLYFSKFFNMNFEPEVMWEFLAKGTNEQINISHLSNALSVFSTKAELAQILSSINTIGTSINQHILNSNIHLTQEEKTFISEIMNKPPWGSNDNRSGLFEYVNVGNASNVIWAARPIKYENKDVGIISNTFISCKGVDVTAGSGGGGITRADLFTILSGEPIDTNEYINAKYLRLDENLKDYAKRDWVELTFIKEETDPTVPVYVKNITEKQILSWDLVASLFKLSADGSYIITNENRGFVSTSFISCKGVDISAPESGSGIDMSLIWYYLGQEGVDQINKSHLIEALEDYATIDWVNNQGYLKSFVEQDPTVPNHVKLITADEITNWNLVSSIFSLSKDSSYVLVENNRGLVSNSFISCKGLDISAPQVGGTFDRSSLFNILSGEPQNGESINLGYLDLSNYATINFVTSQGYITSNYLTGYATEQWVKQQGYLTQHQDLSAYAKSADVALVYATKTALQTLQNEHNALSTKVTNLDNLLNSDVSGVINTWGEVVDFLDEYSGSEDLATILAGMNNDIANRVLIEDFEKLEGSVTGIAGYFTNGSANNALKLGGQLPSYYATVDALNLVKNDVTAVSNRVQKFEDVIGIDSNGDVYIKGMRNFYTAGGTIGMAGLGSGGSGGGGTAGLGSVTVRVNGQDYITDASGIVTLPNYPSLSGYATESWVGNNYLSKSGGVITGDFGVYNPNSTQHTISITTNSGSSWIGYNGTYDYWFITDRGWNSSYALIHSGNYSSYALPLGGGTISVSSGTIFNASYGNDIFGYNPDYGTYVGGYGGTVGGRYYLYAGCDKNPNPSFNINGVINTLYHTGNFNPANYLPLSGGTITGSLTIEQNNDWTPIVFKRGGTSAFIGSAVSLLQLGFNEGYLNIGVNELTYETSGKRYGIIHSGNIGSQSVANADTLDGFHADSFVKSYIDSTDNFTRFTDRAFFQTAWISGQGDFGTLVIPTWTGNNTGTYYTTELRFDIRSTNPKIRITSPDGTSDWYTLARTVDNVASATKLQTARTIWGQSFDGTGNVNGDLNMRYSKITFAESADDYHIGWGSSNMLVYANYFGHYFTTNGSERMRIVQNGNVLIGTTTDAGYRFSVNGGILANTVRTEELRLGEANPGGSVTQNKWYYASIGYEYTDASPNTLKPDIIFKTMYDTYAGGSGVERMRIKSNGNVLIGTTTDSGTAKLQVNGKIKFEARTIWGQSFDGTADVGGNLHLHTSRLYWHYDSNNYCIYSYYDGSTTYLNIKDYGNILFHTSATERMRITSSGNVLIGTTSDNGGKLQVDGNINIKGKNQKIDLTNGMEYKRATVSLEVYESDYAKIQTSLYGYDYLCPLALNPNGGNVIIGSTSDNGSKLQTKGQIDTWNDGDYSGVVGFNRKSTTGGLYNTNIHGWQIHNYKGDLQFFVARTTGTIGHPITIIGGNGNVLVGTTTDNGYKLDVNGTARISSNLAVGGPIDIGLGKLYKYTLYDWVDGVSGFQLIDRSGNTRFGVYSYDGTKKVFVQNCYGGTENCSLELYDNGAIGLTGGNVLIGTTEDNGYKVNVKNTATASYDLHTFNSSTNSSFYVGFESLWYGTAKTSGQIFAIMSGCAYDGGGGNIVFQVTAEGNLTVTGGATFGGDVYSEGTMAMARLTSSSDAKLKDNIKWLSADRAMVVVRALRPTEWDWKKDHTHSFGFIAQDVQPIIPEMVSCINDTLRLEYNQLHAFEIGAIKHIDSEVEILKRRVTALENELKQYRRNA